MHNDEVIAKLNTIQLAVAETTAKMEKLLLAFPSGDIEGHRRYHEAVIEWRELRNKLVREALIKITQAGAVAAFGWLALAIWQSFKLTVKQ